jgi:hypothetical protein
MTFGEFAAWLADEHLNGRLTDHQVADLLAQRMLFDDKRAQMESNENLQFRVAGYVANDLHVEESVSALVRRAIDRYPGRMMYFEPIR